MMPIHTRRDRAERRLLEHVLRMNKRNKDGKTHRYCSIVEARNTGIINHVDFIILRIYYLLFHMFDLQ